MNLRRRRRPSPAIPIVALIDILVITLLFIVVTTTWKKEKTEVKVSLPTANQLGKSVPAKDARKTLTGTKDNKYFLDGKEIAATDLVTALKQLKAASPDAKLEVSIDRKAEHGMYVTALDALVASGFAKDVTTLVQRAVEAANPK